MIPLFIADSFSSFDALRLCIVVFLQHLQRPTVASIFPAPGHAGPHAASGGALREETNAERASFIVGGAQLRQLLVSLGV
jgi:hypothetical protein